MLYSIALASALLAVLLNNQFFLLCSYQHNRKAWLVSQTSKGANASAILYSLIETAKACGIKPYDYLVHVMQKMMEGEEDPNELLPWKVNLG